MERDGIIFYLTVAIRNDVRTATDKAVSTVEFINFRGAVNQFFS